MLRNTAVSYSTPKKKSSTVDYHFVIEVVSRRNGLWVILRLQKKIWV